jgi:hypothetical protein
MSWHDAAKIAESPDDSALRAELQNMLGLAPIQPCHAESTPDSIALAKSLHREAIRRRRTAAAPKPFAKRAFFIAAAAALPLAFTVTALGAWGVKQKRRADAMAAKAQELENRQNRLDAAREGVRNNQPLLQASESHHAPAAQDSGPSRAPSVQGSKGELVKPEEAPRRLNNQPEQHRVRESR